MHITFLKTFGLAYARRRADARENGVTRARVRFIAAFLILSSIDIPEPTIFWEQMGVE